MGAAGSRRPRGEASRGQKLLTPHSHPNSYFIISYKGEKVKVVNAEKGELKILGAIFRRRCEIVKEGWDRNMT